MVETELQLLLPKPTSTRCGDWEACPLSNDQIRYASLDVYATILVYDRLVARWKKMASSVGKSIYDVLKKNTVSVSVPMTESTSVNSRSGVTGTGRNGSERERKSSKSINCHGSSVMVCGLGLHNHLLSSSEDESGPLMVPTCGLKRKNSVDADIQHVYGSEHLLPHGNKTCLLTLQHYHTVTVVASAGAGSATATMTLSPPPRPREHTTASCVRSNNNNNNNNNTDPTSVHSTTTTPPPIIQSRASISTHF